MTKRRRGSSADSRIVICGSMAALPEMQDVQSQLKEAGITAMIHDPGDDDWARLNRQQLAQAKESSSRRQMSSICARETIAVLLVNPDRYGAMDYIGASTFAEAAVAFANHKRIFVLNSFPENYESELEAWGAAPLFGDISKLFRLGGTRTPPQPQLQFFS